MGGARPLRRRRVSLVLLHLQAALGRLPLLAGDDRRNGPAVPAPALEHLRLLRALRQRQRASSSPAPGESTDLDRWVLSRLHATVEVVRDALDDFDATTGGRAIAGFVDELSNWYVRRRGARFWEGDPAAFATLRDVPGHVANCSHRSCPFVADEIYDNLAGAEEKRPSDRLPRVRRRVTLSSTAWRWRARASALDWPPAARRSSRSASRCVPRSWSATGRERAAIERLDEHRPRRAQRARASLRLRGRRAGRGRGQAQLPHARAPVRQADADGGGRHGGARTGSGSPRPARGPSRRVVVGGNDHDLGAEDLHVG